MIPVEWQARAGAMAAKVGFSGLVIAAALAFGTVQTARLEGLMIWPLSIEGWIAKADRFETERDDERSAHRKTKNDYRAAQLAAAEMEAERLKRVAQQQEDITDAIETDYRTRLADARARAERLREELRSREGAAGAGGDLAMSRVPGAAGGSDASTRDHRLPAGSGFDRDPAEQLERDLVATQQALQLDALIDWVERQATVDPNASREDQSSGR
ncbi:MAG: hypothetical protein KKE69_02260 [Alphaproteobacteria bacterium]|nr:hypothetical protein [Alphaproteobacteria bacterium]MBU1606833.1 hypothetical protein [Alphaproteobacteria bacterium]